MLVVGGGQKRPCWGGDCAGHQQLQKFLRAEAADDISSSVTVTKLNKDGRAHVPLGNVTAVNPVKTPKYSRKTSWEALHAQFEMLVRSQNWSSEIKALQLALCLTNDILACLLLLDVEDGQNYYVLVGALHRRFGNFTGADILHTELRNRCRHDCESLHQLSNNIESLTRSSYGNMPPAVQVELARDQFIQGLSPPELRVEVQSQPGRDHNVVAR